MEEAINQSSEDQPERRPENRGEERQDLWNQGDENQRYLTFAYIILGLLGALVLGRFFQFLLNLVFSHVLIDSTWLLRLERMPGPVSPGMLLGSVLALVTMIVLRRNAQVNTFGLEVVAELKKVVWPPLDVTWKSTVAVIVTVIFCSIFLGFFDFLWGALTAFLLS